MNGIHDLGGMHGLGPVEVERNEPNFHEPWEARAFAVMNLTGATGLYNVDELRHAIERMAPAEYLQTSYYVHWIHALESLMAEKGVTSGTPLALAPALPQDRVETAIATGSSTRLDVETAPRFKVGETVIAKTINPASHTRLPRYVRGKTGVVTALRGGFAFPDTRAHSKGDRPQHVYAVRFAAQELWGPDASAKDSLYLDLWDDYLDAA